MLKVSILLPERAFDLIVNKLDGLLVCAVVLMAFGEVDDTLIDYFCRAVAHLLAVVPATVKIIKLYLKAWNT